MKKLRTSIGKAQEFVSINYIIYSSIFLTIGNIYYPFFPAVLMFAPSFTYMWKDRRNKKEYVVSASVQNQEFNFV